MRIDAPEATARGLSHPALSLQDLELDLEIPADTYHSGNSVYICIARSGFSLGC